MGDCSDVEGCPTFLVEIGFTEMSERYGGERGRNRNRNRDSGDSDGNKCGNRNGIVSEIKCQ